MVRPGDGQIGRRSRFSLSLLLASLLLAGCGYVLVSRTRSNVLPERIRRISVSLFENRTYRFGLEADLTDAISAEFATSKALIIGGVSRADAILEGEITELITQPIAYDESNLAKEYEIRMRVKIALRETSAGGIIYRDEVGEKVSYLIASGSEAQALGALYGRIARSIRVLLEEGF